MGLLCFLTPVCLINWNVYGTEECRLLNITYKGHIINEEGHRKIQAAILEYDELLMLVKNPGSSVGLALAY